ncbi:MAG: HAMP domain-containing sensor histidine kinase [Rhodospirillaceae bacterium]|nr:HAMP domain-containing sensor histidine kinase [Rhodospirillaceae bacterium]MDE0616114.1 HAMP domain-containing sensor histidine kinase [Rhodospirillaceae bacterium]
MKGRDGTGRDGTGRDASAVNSPGNGPGNGGHNARRQPAWSTGLSTKLLILTAIFVMLAEVFIYLPSIARYRQVYLENVLSDAHLATLALDAAPDNMVSPDLSRRLLSHARALAIVQRRADGSRHLITAGMPPRVTGRVSLGNPDFLRLIWDAIATLAGGGGEVLRVVGPSPRDPATALEVLISDAALRQGMLEYSQRILILSLIISFFTALLVFLTLHWLIVRPVQRLTDNMVRFSDDPMDEAGMLPPTGRLDEIGLAQDEYAHLQQNLLTTLRQNERLAALGAAITRINHDLRNMLAAAQLVSDRLAGSEDPGVKRIAPTLVRSIDRAVRLCTQTLDFARDSKATRRAEYFFLNELTLELASLHGAEYPGTAFVSDMAGDLTIFADRGQVFRALSNLMRNAAQAGAQTVTVGAEAAAGLATIDIRDDGPGLPEDIRQSLFKPFITRPGAAGTGLGMAIAHEIVSSHGGVIELVATGHADTHFRISLPQGAAPPVEDAPAENAPAENALAENSPG